MAGYSAVAPNPLHTILKMFHKLVISSFAVNLRVLVFVVNLVDAIVFKSMSFSPSVQELLT